MAHILIHGAGDVGWYWLWSRSNCVNEVTTRAYRRGSIARWLHRAARLRPSGGRAARPPRAHDPLPGRVACGLLDGYQIRGAGARTVRRSDRAVLPGRSAETCLRGTEAGARPVRGSNGGPWPLKAWPDVPTRVLLCREDRLFPASFLRRVSHTRLGITSTRSTGGTPPH